MKDTLFCSIRARLPMFDLSVCKYSILLLIWHIYLERLLQRYDPLLKFEKERLLVDSYLVLARFAEVVVGDLELVRTFLAFNFNEFSFYNSRESILNTSADNWKPQAGGHVAHPRWRSQAEGRFLRFFSSLFSAILALAVFSLCAPSN